LEVENLKSENKELISKTKEFNDKIKALTEINEKLRLETLAFDDLHIIQA